MNGLFKRQDPFEELHGHIKRYVELGEHDELDRSSYREAKRLRSRLERAEERGVYRGQALSALSRNPLIIALASHNPTGLYWIQRKLRYKSSIVDFAVTCVHSHRKFKPGDVFEPLVHEDSDPIILDLKRGRIRKIVSMQTTPDYLPDSLVFYGIPNIENLAKRHGMNPEYVFHRYIMHPNAGPLEDVALKLRYQPDLHAGL